MIAARALKFLLAALITLVLAALFVSYRNPLFQIYLSGWSLC